MKKSTKQLITIHLTLLSVVAACYAKEPTKIILQAEDAHIEGTIKYYKEHNFIGHWHRPEDVIHFKISDLDDGKYKVITKYACPDENGGKISIKLNIQEFKRTFGATGSWSTPIDKTIGYFEHEGGPVDISLTILKQNREKAVIDLHALTLEKM